MKRIEAMMMLVNLAVVGAFGCDAPDTTGETELVGEYGQTVIASRITDAGIVATMTDADRRNVIATLTYDAVADVASMTMEGAREPELVPSEWLGDRGLDDVSGALYETWLVHTYHEQSDAQAYGTYWCYNGYCCAYDQANDRISRECYAATHTCSGCCTGYTRCQENAY